MERIGNPLPEPGAAAPRYAVLPPFPSLWVMAKLRAAGVDGGKVRQDAAFYRQGGHHQFADQLEFAWLQLRASEVSARAVTAVDGTAEAEPAEDQTQSYQQQTLTTKEVAEMLNVTERRVRQMLTAGSLAGRQSGRSWLIERDSVERVQTMRGAA